MRRTARPRAALHQNGTRRRVTCQAFLSQRPLKTRFAACRMPPAQLGGDTLRKIGILGGSFNPVHHGHLVLAERALEEPGLDRVVFVPARLPPHKGRSELADARHRIAMVRLAVAGNPRLGVSDMELKRAGPSYTVDTVEAFRRRFGGQASIFFLIGADTLSELKSWREIRRLAKMCSFVPFSRPGSRGPREATLARAVGAREARAIMHRAVGMPLVGISASDIRRRLANGRSIRYLTPDAVVAYIRRNRLYQYDAAISGSRQPPRCS